MASIPETAASLPSRAERQQEERRQAAEEAEAERRHAEEERRQEEAADRAAQALARGQDQASREAQQIAQRIGRLPGTVKAADRDRLLKTLRGFQDAVATADTPAAVDTSLQQLRNLGQRVQVEQIQGQEAERRAQREKRDKEREAARQQHSARGLVHGSEASKHPLERTHLFAASPVKADVRMLDVLIAMGVSAGASLWTASRNHNGTDILWAIFWDIMGGFMAMEGSGALQLTGFGLVGSQSSYLILRLVGGEPQVL